MRSVKFLALAAFGTVTVLGCEPHDVVITTPSPAPQSRSLANSTDLNPGDSPATRATLTLSGTPFEVDVVTKRNRSHLTIESQNHGSELEVEEYQDGFDAFRFVKGGGETYEPSIDLLRFPMRVGDSWKWKGKITSMGSTQDATAKVETLEETVFIGEAPVKAVTSRVTLVFAAQGSNEHAQRVLSFSFAPGKGLFRRQFDSISIRESSK